MLFTLMAGAATPLVSQLSPNYSLTPFRSSADWGQIPITFSYEAAHTVQAIMVRFNSFRLLADTSDVSPRFE